MVTVHDIRDIAQHRQIIASIDTSPFCLASYQAGYCTCRGDQRRERSSSGFIFFVSYIFVLVTVLEFA